MRVDVTYPDLAPALLELGERDVAVSRLNTRARLLRREGAPARIRSDLQSVKITR